MSDMGRSGRSRRVLVSGMACLLCVWLLVSVALESGTTPPLQGGKATPPFLDAAAADASRQSLRKLDGSAKKERPIKGMNLDPFLSSKRRVPNGPDPIHNRRAGKSGRPPVRA